MAIPVIGRLYHHSVLSRMAQAMAILVGAGCDMAECLRLGAVATGSEKLYTDTRAIGQTFTTGFGVDSLNSVLLASVKLQIFLAKSITAH